jgi:hypothetical protein
MTAAVHRAGTWWRPTRTDGLPILALVVDGATATASSSATHHPAGNVVAASRPYQTWRSTTAGGDAWVRIDWGHPRPLAGILLQHANVSSVALAASQDGTTWTDLGTVPLGRDRRVGRRKRWVPFGAGIFVHRYLRISLPAAALDAGAAYHELGAVACCYPLLCLSDGVRQPIRHARADGRGELELVSGGVEVSADGPARLELVVQPLIQKARGGRTRTLVGGETVEGEYGWGTTGFGTGGWMSGLYETRTAGTVLTQVTDTAVGEREAGALAAIGMGTPLVYVEPSGDPTLAYLVRRVRAAEGLTEALAWLEHDGLLLQEAV